MLLLPFRALSVLFSKPKILALGFFPGAFSFAGASLADYLLWMALPENLSRWIALPALMAGFLLAWLVLGSFSLVFVEDALIDACQMHEWGEVRLLARPFSANRLLREFAFALLVGVAALFFFVLSFFPALAPICVAGTAWLTAYGFLGPLYERKRRGESRLSLFFAHPFSNLALGLALNVLLFVPIVNVFLLGYAQIFATLLFLRREGLSSNRRTSNT